MNSNSNTYQMTEKAMDSDFFRADIAKYGFFPALALHIFYFIFVIFTMPFLLIGLAVTKFNNWTKSWFQKTPEPEAEQINEVEPWVPKNKKD